MTTTIALLNNSFLWALVIALTCFKSYWLEMRVNIGIILFASWAVIFIAALLAGRRTGKQFGLLFTLLNTAVCSCYGLLLYGPKRLTVVPAAIIREGLGLTHLRFPTINLALVSLALAVILLLIVAQFRKRRGSIRDQKTEENRKIGART